MRNRLAWLGAGVTITLGLAACAKRAAPAPTTPTASPAPVDLKALAAACHQAGWFDLVRDLAPYVAGIVAIFVLAPAIRAGWSTIRQILGQLFSRENAPKTLSAGAATLATIYAGFREGLGPESAPIVLTGGVMLLLPLVALLSDRLWVRAVAILAGAALVVGATSAAVWLWPYEDPQTHVRISAPEAVVGQIGEAKPTEVATLALLVILYGLYAILMLTRRKPG